MSRPSIQQCALVVAALVSSSSARATDYYVNDASTVGDVATPGCPLMGVGVGTAGCGSCAAPCSGPQLAYSTLPLSGGDTVYLNTGVYLGTSGPALLGVTDSSKQGSPGMLLSFVGPLDATGHAAVDGTGKPLALLDGANLATSGVLISVPYVRVAGLGLRRPGGRAAVPPGAVSAGDRGGPGERRSGGGRRGRVVRAVASGVLAGGGELRAGARDHRCGWPLLASPAAASESKSSPVPRPWWQFTAANQPVARVSS